MHILDRQVNGFPSYFLLESTEEAMQLCLCSLPSFILHVTI